MKKFFIIGGSIFLAGFIMFFTAFSYADYDITKFSTAGRLEKQQMDIVNTNQNITVNDKNTQVEIKKSDDEKIHITYFTSEKENYTVDTKSDITFTKNLNYKWYDYIFNLNFQQKTFIISLPEDYNGKINITTSNAKISVDNIKALKLEFSTSNGTYEIKNVKCENLTAQTSNGSIDIENCKIDDCDLPSSNAKINTKNSDFNILKAQSSNGRINLDNDTVFEKLTIETSNGAIDLKNLTVKGDVSLVTSNGSITGNINEKMSQFSIKSHTSNASNNLPSDANMGSQSLYVESSNGKIELNFAN